MDATTVECILELQSVDRLLVFAKNIRLGVEEFILRVHLIPDSYVIYPIFSNQRFGTSINNFIYKKYWWQIFSESFIRKALGSK